MKSVRVTVAVAEVIRVFLEDPTEPRYGYDLMRLTKFPSGKLYPVLARLHAAGWLLKESETIDPVTTGRPVRQMYRIHPDCVSLARQELAVLYERIRPPTPYHGRLSPNGGTS